MNDDDLPATRGDLRAVTNALRDEIRTLESTLRDELASKDDLRELEHRLGTELAQHANAIMEANRSDMRSMLDPLLSLPARVDKLEAAVQKPRRRSSR